MSVAGNRTRPPTAGATTRTRRRRRRKERPRVRRTTGKKSKNARVAIVGGIYTLQPTPEGVEGPIHKRLYATFESHRALFKWLRCEADKRGYGQKRTVFLGDGSDHIWRLQQEYFPQAEACIDWYHVMEYLWSGGQAIHQEGSPELLAWLDGKRGCCARVRQARPSTSSAQNAKRFRRQDQAPKENESAWTGLSSISSTTVGG